MNSKKILFVLNGDEYFRNYITSDSLSAIKKDCFIALNKKLVNNNIPNIEKNRLGDFVYSKDKERLHFHLFNTNTRRFRQKSKTFYFRYLRLPRRLKIKYSVLSLPVVYQIFKFYVFIKTRDEKLEKFVIRINPSLILIPSSGFEGVTFEFIRIAKKNKIPVCLLIDNWDNLCSKTIFTRKPDFLAVWGKQSQEHAGRIHGIDKQRVFILGTPRFAQYFDEKKRNLSSPYPFRYALFAGNAIPFDEITALKAIDRLIDKSKEKIKIVYRPHPWRHPRKCFDTFFEYDFKNVILDEDAREYYKKENDFFAPNLEYYPKLLSNMEYMICPLSTMLIEGLIFNKKVYVLAYDDNVHLTNPKNAFKYYEHFEGINKLKNVEIIDRIEDLANIAKKAHFEKGSEYRDLDYYISRNTGSYAENLKKISDEIIVNWRSYDV